MNGCVKFLSHLFNLSMIQNNQELEATLERLERFQNQVKKLQEIETNPRNYELSAGGFLTEIDQMNLEVQHYLTQVAT